MNRSAGFGSGLPVTKVVKWLVIVNVSIWFLGQVLLEGFILNNDLFSGPLSLVPEQVLFQGAAWQVVTYMFLHSQQITHILFNMLMLWFFGAELEQRWGSRFFLIYYFVCGIGAGILYVTCNALAVLLFGFSPTNLMIPVIGASGAIFGLLLAYGMLFGERVIHFMMIFPMKAKFFVMIMGFVELASLITSRERGSDVAYLAHLGGLASGYLFLKGWSLWQRRTWNRKLSNKHKGRNLRLVVDNEKDDDKKGPQVLELTSAKGEFHVIFKQSDEKFEIR